MSAGGPRYPVSLVALVPGADDHRIAFVRWVGRETLGMEGVAELTERRTKRWNGALDLCLPAPWNAPPLRLHAVFRWVKGERAVLHVAGADDGEHHRWAQLVEAAAEGPLADRRRIPRPGATERRDRARYGVRGLRVRAGPETDLLDVAELGEGGFSVRGRLAAGPPTVFELSGDERWPGLPLWVAGRVVRSGRTSGVRALAANYDRYLALVRHARTR